jgi:hypothetical protein
MIGMLLADYRANGRRSDDRAGQACAHLRRFFEGGCKARDITADRITAYQATRLEEGAKPSTVNYECAMLRRGFRLAARAGKVGVRPEFSMLEVHNTRTGFFEPDRYRAVLGHLPDYLKPVAEAAYITGWRTNSELLTRQWRHVDLPAASGWRFRLRAGIAAARGSRRWRWASGTGAPKSRPTTLLENWSSLTPRIRIRR